MAALQVRRFAILDIGTNTFHLLIIEKQPKGSPKVLYKSEKFVKLGEEGIHHIGDAAFKRGIKLLTSYKEQIDKYKPQQVFAFGTAAIRRADNSEKFIAEVKKQTGIKINKITGDKEARYIYLGVRSAVELDKSLTLIMDIGGGSTEFIIADNKKIYWKQSFPLGASVLLHEFHKTNVIRKKEITRLNSYLEITLQPLLKQLKKYQIKKLVGASGSFDSLAEMTAHIFYSPEILKGKTSFKVDKAQFRKIYNLIVSLTLEERLQLKGLKKMRAEMIVVAFILMKFILSKINVEEIYQSEYALKEGVLWSLLNK